MFLWVGEAGISALAILMGLLFWVGSFGFTPAETGVDLGAAFFPRALSLILILLGCVLFMKSIVCRRSAKQIPWRSFMQAFGGILLSMLYIFLIPAWGYFYATVCFCPLLLLYQGYRNAIWIVLTTAGFSVMAYFVFYRFLSVTLPL